MKNETLIKAINEVLVAASDFFDVPVTAEQLVIKTSMISDENGALAVDIQFYAVVTEDLLGHGEVLEGAVSASPIGAIQALRATIAEFAALD